jgi:hypothetical protein
MNRQLLWTMADARYTVCPHCRHRPMVLRSNNPRIDECGFESYDFDCPSCDAPLAGIIDPRDDVLLISNTAA